MNTTIYHWTLFTAEGEFEIPEITRAAEAIDWWVKSKTVAPEDPMDDFEDEFGDPNLAIDMGAAITVAGLRWAQLNIMFRIVDGRIRNLEIGHRKSVSAEMAGDALERLNADLTPYLDLTKANTMGVLGLIQKEMNTVLVYATRARNYNPNCK